MIRGFLEAGDYWGVGVDKKPTKPKAWKREKHKLMPFADASVDVAKRRDKGHNSQLYFVLNFTKIRSLDIDIPAGMTEFRQDQLELLDHYRKIYPAPIDTSVSGNGKHIYLNDPDGLLPMVGKSYVNKGDMPCEILHGIVFMSDHWETSSGDIPVVDDYILSLVTKLKTRKPDEKGNVKIHKDLPQLLAQLDYLHANNIEYLPPHRKEWGAWCTQMLAFGATRDQVLELSRRRPDFDTVNDDTKDILQMTPRDCDVDDEMEQFLGRNYQLGEQLGLTPDFDLSQFGFTPPKKISKRKPVSKADILVVDTGKPIIDYQRCLDRMGFLIRDHAFLGFQWSPDNGETWLDYRSGMHANIYKKILQNVAMAKHNAPPEPPSFTVGERREALEDLMYSNKYNPLLEYIEQLKEIKKTPNHEAKFLLGKIFRFVIPEDILARHNLTIDHTGVRDFFGDVLLLTIKGIVARALKAGANFPYFPLFKGPQGCGKSLFVEEILPLIARSGHADSFDWGMPAKERDMILRSAAVVECSEMVGHGRRAVTDHKLTISSKKTMHRAPFQLYPELMTRNAIMIGTTNEQECLTADPSGNRRYIILPVDLHDGWQDFEVETKLPAIMNEWRDQLFLLAIRELEAERGCSLAHWQPTSRVLLQELYGATEQRHYPIEIAIDKLLEPIKESDDSKSPELCLTTEEKLTGVPLTVPVDSPARSLMKMIMFNAQRNSAIHSKMTPEWLATHLIKKGWINCGRQRLPKADGGGQCTYYRPDIG